MTHFKPSQTQAQISKKLGGFKATWFYRFLLCGPAPKGPRFKVDRLWPGDPQRGLALLKGQFRFQEETHVLTAAAVPPLEASDEWLAWFHSLDWLLDLMALKASEKGPEAAFFAREWITAWIDLQDTWSKLAWAPSVTGERLINLMSAWDFLIKDESARTFEKILRQTVGKTARHLFKSTPKSGTGFDRLHTIKGQFFAAFALLGGERCQQKILLRLENEISAQVFPDGGHVERNPQCLYKVLYDLLELKAFSCVAIGQVPDFIQKAIDRSAPMLRALRHADGRLGVFNGGLEADAKELDQLLGLTDPTTTPPLSAPYAGFQKLSADTTTLLMDCGKPGGAGQHHHAGTLSFEMCVGKNRLIVNCGARPGRTDPWRTALAATAAHSSLTVNDTSSAAFDLHGILRRGPGEVTSKRQDSDLGTLVEASHDGYVSTFGLIHHRSLFLSPTGDDVRGEDRVSGTGGQYATLRFHLHPDVHVSLLGVGSGALLRLNTKKNDTWRLRASIGEIKLEESVYVGRLGEHRRTEQIVITIPLSGNGALIKWSLKREGTTN